MKVICLMVQSVDGKITKGNNPKVWEWSSKEDQDYFLSVIQSHNLIVMGRKTYEAAHPKPSPGKRRVIITRNPDHYQSQSIPDQLEFTNKTPGELVNQFKDKYKEMLLVGGPEINTQFFKESLVDELWLTIEPRIFGEGKMIVGEEELDIQLKLLGVEELNKTGTILLKYKVNP